MSPVAHCDENTMTNTNEFYAGLTPLYHLIYPDWDKSIRHQGDVLDSVIREMWGPAKEVLDVSCGIGTQALSLSRLGYTVTASDLSPEAVERARQGAAKRELSIIFSTADMRRAFDHHQRQFDVVISCDNSVPHLLSDGDILAAMKQFYSCTRPGGGCIITVRDYEKEDLSEQQVKPYGIREDHGIRWLLWQVWDPHPPTYDVTMYFVEDRGEPICRTQVLKTTYYAIGISSLVNLMEQAGFKEVRRLNHRFFQPMIIGTKKHDRAVGGAKPPPPTRRTSVAI
jgi:SAM-dependent methyltransferase